MTNEQAIVILKDTRTAWSSSILVTPDELEALNMAVQALQADGDLISRQSAIKALRFQYPMMPITKEFRQQWEIETKGFREAEEVIMQLPSVAIPTEHDGCKDCKHENKSDGEYPCSYCKQNYEDMWERKSHPHWINARVGKLFPSNDYKCSECGNILDFDGLNCGRGDANYCPNCGAKMD